MELSMPRPLKLATFRFDITPPLGHSRMDSCDLVLTSDIHELITSVNKMGEQ